MEHFLFFPCNGNVIIPTDFHIFQRGRYTTNQIIADIDYTVDSVFRHRIAYNLRRFNRHSWEACKMSMIFHRGWLSVIVEWMILYHPISISICNVQWPSHDSDFLLHPNFTVIQWYLVYPCIILYPCFQWEFKDPKLEVPTIYKTYFSRLCKGISPQNMARNMVLTYLHLLDPEIPIDVLSYTCQCTKTFIKIARGMSSIYPRCEPWCWYICLQNWAIKMG